MDLASRWRGSDQTSEGTVFIKDQNIAIGVENDNEYVYLTLQVADPARQRQISFRGLTVWFDYQGGEKRRFGVRYPVAGERTEERRSDAERTADTLRLFPENIPDEVEVIGPMEGEHHRMHLAETGGIDAKIENRSGTMKYFLRVPLMDNGSHLYGIGARTGMVIGLGLETAGFSGGGRGAGPRMGGGGPGGGMGGRGGRRGGRVSPGSEGGSASAPQPIEFWAKIHIAQTAGQ